MVTTRVLGLLAFGSIIFHSRSSQTLWQLYPRHLANLQQAAGLGHPSKQGELDLVEDQRHATVLPQGRGDYSGGWNKNNNETTCMGTKGAGLSQQFLKPQI